MKKSLFIFMSILILLLLISTLYLYSQFPGFKVSMSSDYKLGFNIEPKKVITEHECSIGLNKDFKERLANYCQEEGFNISAQEIGDDYNLKDCSIPDDKFSAFEKEYQTKAEFCTYLFK